jgi:hypothetical protein
MARNRLRGIVSWRDWADPEVSSLKPFKSGSDVSELLQLLTTAVEGNRLILAERGFIFSGNLVRQFQNVEPRRQVARMLARSATSSAWKAFASAEAFFSWHWL